MDHDIPLLNPDDLEYLSPEVQKAVVDIRTKSVAVLASHAPELAVAKAHVHAAMGSVNSSTRRTQTAQAHGVVLAESIGPLAIGPSQPKELFVNGVLVGAALAETYFAFPGVRFALGQVGQINSPLDDPWSLGAAAVIGLVSVTAAHFAGQHFSWSERSVMLEPRPAEISHQLGAPRPVHADPENAKLLEDSPLAEFGVSAEPDDLLGTRTVGSPQIVPPSQEVLNEEANHRHKEILWGGRSKGLSRGIGLGLVICGLCLWIVSGVMRSAYLERLPGPTTPAPSGIFAPTSVPTAHLGLSSGATEVTIIAFSMLVFLLSVAIVFAVHPPAVLRSKELQRNQRNAERDLIKRIRAAEKAIRRFETVRSAIDVQKINGRAGETIARMPLEDL